MSERLGQPEDVRRIKAELKKFLDQTHQGIKLRSAHGVYAFFDYDGEPIYVGQTSEGLGARIGRHLTNQRTDAVAMNVLDPFEVSDIEVWPIPPIKSAAQNQLLDRMEYAVFLKVLGASAFGAVLNEKDILPTTPVELPTSIRERIVPAGVYEPRSHPDIRIARRASTIAKLAQVVSEREVSAGLRRTLLTQAKRLEALASKRYQEFRGEEPNEAPGEEV